MAANRALKFAAFEIAEAAPDDKEKNLGRRMCKAYPGYTWRALAMGMVAKAVLSTGLKRRKI